MNRHDYSDDELIPLDEQDRQAEDAVYQWRADCDWIVEGVHEDHPDEGWAELDLDFGYGETLPAAFTSESEAADCVARELAAPSTDWQHLRYRHEPTGRAVTVNVTYYTTILATLERSA